MKYINISGKFILVDSDATGQQIKAYYVNQTGVGIGSSDDWELQAHLPNGSSVIVEEDDIPVQFDFTIQPIFRKRGHGFT